MKASCLGDKKCHLCLFPRALSEGARQSVHGPLWNSEGRNQSNSVFARGSPTPALQPSWLLLAGPGP